MPKQFSKPGGSFLYKLGRAQRRLQNNSRKIEKGFKAMDLGKPVKLIPRKKRKS